MFTIHKRCNRCGKLGHKSDMKDVYIPCVHGEGYTDWYHEECYMEKFGVMHCPCGKGYVNSATAGAIKPPKGGTGETRRKR